MAASSSDIRRCCSLQTVSFACALLITKLAYFFQGSMVHVNHSLIYTGPESQGKVAGTRFSALMHNFVLRFVFLLSVSLSRFNFTMDM